jgi:hypothetical protein
MGAAMAGRESESIKGAFVVIGFSCELKNRDKINAALTAVRENYSIFDFLCTHNKLFYVY